MRPLHLPDLWPRPSPTPTNSPDTPTPSKVPRPSPPRAEGARRGTALALLGVLGTVALMLFAGLAGTTSGATAPTAAREPTAAAPAEASALPASGTCSACGTWAWGEAANLTAGLEFEGAYNASSFLSGEPLSTAGAYIDLEASLSAEWTSYAIVNATSPSPGQLAVTLQAGDLLDIDLMAVAQGDFPAAGTYGPDTNVTLVPMNLSLLLHLSVTDRYNAYLNLSDGPNGSLALENEHLQYLRTIALSLDAVNFPNVTASGGEETVSYLTAAVQATVQIEATLTGNFTPALVLVEAPVTLGETWSTSSNAVFVGSVSWTETASGILPSGQPFTYSNGGQDSADADVGVDLQFTVVSERTVFFPDGTSEVDYVLQANAVAGGVTLEDGLWVLPGAVADDTATLGGELAEHPATEELSDASSTPSRGYYSPARHMTDDSDATPVSGTTVEGSPMSPAQARSALAQLGGLTPLTPHAVSDLELELALVGALALAGAILVREVRRRRRNKSW